MVQQVLQQHAKNPQELLIYIGFDEYTLYQVEMHNFCSKITAKKESKIICKNIVDFSLEKGGNNGKLFTLRECLLYLKESYPDQSVNIVIDEYDSEELTNEEAESVSKILCEHKPFADSQILIAVQSCLKRRYKKDHLGRVTEQERNCFNDTGMEICDLPKTMRFNDCIHKVVSSSQEKVQEKTNLYRLPSKDAKIFPEDVKEMLTSLHEDHQIMSSSQEKVEDKNDYYYLPSQDAEIVSENVGETPVAPSNVFPEDDAPPTQKLDRDFSEHRMVNPTPKIDSLCKEVNVENSTETLVTKFEYFQHSQSGSGVTGEQPLILRISDFEKRSLAMMKYFLKRCLKLKQDHKLMIICNSLELLPFAKYCLKIAHISYAEYTDCIRHLPARTLQEKITIYEKWKNDVQVLLVDCRGCRGMEFQKVCLLLKTVY